MTSCTVCGVRTLKTRETLARTCSGCGKALCNAHTHFYVDGNNRAITDNAPPKCAACSGMVTIHCFFGGCPHIVEHRDPKQGAAIMQGHYDREHAGDLTRLGYPTEPRHHGFQMQSHHKGVWTAMEDGPAKSTWRPRKTAEEAVLKCLTWTGLICIPAMRVVDLATSTVVWQDRWADGRDSGLDRIMPTWAVPLYEQARRDLAATDEVIGRAVDEYVPERTAPAVVDDGALFSLAEVSA